MSVVLRLGVPLTGGLLVRTARDLKAPILFSANAFRRDGKWRRFGSELAGLPIALDSAGFVAMVKYGGYPWSRSEYLDLVQTGTWDWYATRDFCCEPQIARFRADVAARIEATASEFHALRQEARDRGIEDPMPVLQGWFPDEYERCADLYRLDAWPALIGIGSVCRRNMSGPDGVIRIVNALDRILPAGVGFHLFGVKGTALASLRDHPRIASADSMAWDFGARRRFHRTPQVVRAEAMRRWYGAMTAALDEPAAQLPLLA